MGAHIGSAIQDLVTISNDADNRRKLRVKKDKNQKRKESVTDRSNLETVT